MTVQLFINYLEGQPPGPLPPQARPAGAANRQPELREWQAICHIHRERLFEVADYTGLLSPKFPRKTGLAFERVVAFIDENPGHDVYLFDHAARYRYYNFNNFEYADNHVPGFGVKFDEMLGPMEKVADFATLGRSLPANSIHSNYWVGNHRFWREVVGQAAALIDLIGSRPATWRCLCEPVIADGMIYPFLPILLERFVSYWLMTRSGISAMPYAYDKAYVLASSVRTLERECVAGFYELFNQWDDEDGWTPDRREFVRDLSLAVHRHRRASGNHLVDPWTGERIAPVR